jgi:mannose-6-phosphate isomerase-like protein (cupin superfamily)
MFEERGYAGPLPLFSADQCQRIAALREDVPPAFEWYKGYAAASPLYCALGRHPALVDLVSGLLGEDVILWGASMVDRRPGQVHPWHTDLETADPGGSTVTAWIGISNTRRESSLAVIPRSHRFGQSLQEVGHGLGLARGEAATADIEAWARQRDARSRIVQLDMTDGDVLLFDGRLWHGSNNLLREGTRTALILQYATPGTPIRIPDPAAGFEWPFHFLDHPRPPCVVVCGQADSDANRIVDGPVFAGVAGPVDRALAAEPLAPCWIREVARWDEDPDSGWAIYSQFEGETPCLDYLEVHASVLSAGAVPHAPHHHAEEEIIVPLGGEVEILTAEDAHPDATRSRRIGPGAVVYHRAHQVHTIRSVGPGPASYCIFKWRNVPARGPGSAADSSVWSFGSAGAGAASEDPGVAYEWIFDLETGYLDRLHAHFTTLDPAAGYAAHVDPYDVGIIVLEGEVETLGRRVGPGGVIFYPAGEPHGMRNPGDEPAAYLVVELHGTRRPAPAPAGRWRRRLRRVLGRVRRLAGRVARRLVGRGPERRPGLGP